MAGSRSTLCCCSSAIVRLEIAPKPLEIVGKNLRLTIELSTLLS